MKIVDFDTFNRMPAGTIFAPYMPCILEESLSVKVEHGGEFDNNWNFNGVMTLEPFNLDSMLDNESARATFEIYDGDTNYYREYDRFLIFEDDDIDRLIQVLLWAKGGCNDKDYHGFNEM